MNPLNIMQQWENSNAIITINMDEEITILSSPCYKPYWHTKSRQSHRCSLMQLMVLVVFTLKLQKHFTNCASTVWMTTCSVNKIYISSCIAGFLHEYKASFFPSHFNNTLTQNTEGNTHSHVLLLWRTLIKNKATSYTDLLQFIYLFCVLLKETYLEKTINLQFWDLCGISLLSVFYNSHEYQYEVASLCQ